MPYAQFCLSSWEKKNMDGKTESVIQFKVWEQLQRSSLCDSAQIFRTSKFSYLQFFSNPTHISKSKGLQIGGRLLIETHLDRSLLLAIQK
jgi:hypothetical protein